MALLKGRFGYYQPRTPEEKIRARRREERRRQEAAAAAAWLRKTRWCVAGCGREAARYEDSIGKALRFDGACSPECQAAWERRQTDEKAD